MSRSRDVLEAARVQDARRPIVDELIARELGEERLDAHELGARRLVLQPRVLVDEQLVVGKLELAVRVQARAVAVGVEEVVEYERGGEQHARARVQAEASASPVVRHVVVAQVELGRVLHVRVDGGSRRRVEVAHAVVCHTIAQHVHVGVALARRRVVEGAQLVADQGRVAHLDVRVGEQVLSGGEDDYLGYEAHVLAAAARSHVQRERLATVLIKRHFSIIQ